MDEEIENPVEVHDLEMVEESSIEEEEESVELSGTELADFDSGEVEDLEFIDLDQIQSIIESILFSTDKPQSLAAIKQAFSGTQVKSKQIRKAIEDLMVDYASTQRGITLEEVSGGYQLRTKVDNMDYLRRMVKSRPFKVSGPAMEVLSIIAYKQPCVKHEVDEIRGVESGHLLRGLMEKGLVAFAGKSELPGKPMLYATTRKFLEIFGLRSLEELPSLSEIDDLIPEGIGGEEEEKETLDQVADRLASEEMTSYSQGEEELEKITDTLSGINVSSEFFEQEKQRMKDKRDAERARDLQEALDVGEEIADKDQKWLERYLAAQQEVEAESVVEAEATTPQLETVEIEAATVVEAETPPDPSAEL